jgi:DNA invertase Pin-like site-specific DNA recombinase
VKAKVLSFVRTLPNSPLEDQRRAVTAYATTHGLLPLKEHAGDDLEHALVVLTAGDHLILPTLRVIKAARLIDVARLLGGLISRGVHLHILSERWVVNTPETARIFLQAMAAIEGFEEDHRESIRVALAWRKERGLPIGGPPPVGWAKFGKGSASRLVPCPESRKRAYSIVELHDKHGFSFENIPSMLRRCGLQAPTTKHKRKNPAKEMSHEACRQHYHAAKRGFPLPNGVRQHLFGFEPERWRSWGIEYTPGNVRPARRAPSGPSWRLPPLVGLGGR